MQRQTEKIQTYLTPQQGLKIQLPAQNTHFQIKSLTQIGLTDWFDSLDDLNQYINADSKNTMVRETQQGSMVFEILYRPSTKKCGCIVIGKIGIKRAEIQSKDKNVEQLATNLDQKLNIYGKNYKLSTNIQKSPQSLSPQPVQTPTSISKSWIDLTIQDYWRLNLQQNKVINTFGRAFVKGTKIIPDQYQFTLKIGHFNNFISIGIIDRELLCLMPGKKNLFSYSSSGSYFDGQKSVQVPEEQNKMKGFKIDDEVSVKVNKNKGLIEWIINGDLRHRCETNLFKTQNIVWVPYVYMPEGGDSFYIIDK